MSNITTYSNYEWAANQDLSKFEGKWIAIVDQKIVADSINAAKAREEALKKYPNSTPFLKKVPLMALTIL